MFSWIVNKRASIARILALLMCATLPGCINASDSDTLATLQDRGKSVGFFSFYFAGDSCSASRFILAFDNGKYFEAKFSFNEVGTPVRIAPGDYHVVSVTCASVVNARLHYKTLAKHTKGINTKYLQSYATFSVRPGEIASFGVLGLHVRDNTVYRLETRDFSAAEKARMRRKYPNLYPKAKLRLMQAKLRNRSGS